LYERKVGIQFIGILVAPPDSKFSELGDAALGVTGPSQWEAKATHTEAEASALGIEWYGPTGEEFSAAYEAAFGEKPTYHVAGGYAAGLLLEKAILNADSVDSEAVKAALDAMNFFTFYGGIKFDTSAEAHGLQIAHSMVVIQWQKNEAGELVREVVWPADVATKDPIFPISVP
jgi:branched-chain amino acid transport system substrate-binding protein